jgi:hypothetical protein
MTKMAADKVPDKLPAIHEERSFSLNRGTAPLIPHTRGKSQHSINFNIKMIPQRTMSLSIGLRKTISLSIYLVKCI